MMRPTKAGTILTAVLILSACATISDAPVKYADGVMVNEAGLTVYTFDKDPAGKSVCNDKCAMNWPPLRASADSDAGGDFSVITRNDGTRQWAHKGKPLYLWIKDRKPGDKTGDGVNDVWHVVKQARGSMSGY